MADTFLL